jgi:hypothetical protein
MRRKCENYNVQLATFKQKEIPHPLGNYDINFLYRQDSILQTSFYEFDVRYLVDSATNS